MSTSPFPAPFLVQNPARLRNNVVALPRPDSAERARLVRRRPDRRQGEALVVLGHALEYLVDTRMFVYREPNTKADAEAIHLLSRCSREVYGACAEVVPVRQRVKMWLAERLGLGEFARVGHASTGKV